MRDFEEVDIFFPNEMCKSHMKTVYNIFAQMIMTLVNKLDQISDPLVECMSDYAPLEWELLTQNYYITFTYEEKHDVLYVELYFADLVDGKHSTPLVFMNGSGNKAAGFDCDTIAYTFMTAYINHIGLMTNRFEELIEKKKQEETKNE